MVGWVETGLAGVAGLKVILTDAEVVAYVENLWKRSGIWHLREACVLSPEALAVDSYLAGVPGRAEFETAGRAGMVANMLRLNSLPRTDPFWHNTNLRPTVFKLREFCSLVLREEPDDLPSLWTLAVLNTLESGYFEVPIWERMAAVEPAWFAAALLMGASFENTAERFVLFVGTTGQRDRVLRILERDRGSGGPWMVEWAGEVERLLA